ncbi:peptidoglycan editing factor PgeF [Defluviitalea phaphyphila]|uniref:peptidoglycan editing factor PgeF n=1 Tax=Defluviitalea phaphyphila TaxID=1473580 RepID=UPI000731B881|nr:peptidoglycan editing factor PgeF [Defluviitalea phaphyphila]
MYQNRTQTLSFHQKNNLFYITFPSFDKTDLVNHCFSTRLGGVSKGIYESLNLGFGRGDNEENVKTNYKILCSAIGIDYNKLIFSDQVHGKKIRVIKKEDISDNFNFIKYSKEIDGLATNIPKIPLITFYADCVPLFFLDPVAKAVGLAHAGWRGTVKKIGLEMIKIFKKEFNSNPKDTLVGIGPSIGKCCFEVDKPVVDEFEKIFVDTKNIIYSQNNGKYVIDLWKANEKTLLEGGILPSNITVTDMCTKCNKDIFFSHRGHNGKRGNLAAIIELK